VSLVINEVRTLERGLRLLAREIEASTGASAAQLFVLEQLADGAGRSLSELAQLTLTDRSSVSVAVDRLVASELASRGKASRDRRRAVVRITAAGRRALTAAPPAPTRRLIEAVAGLPAHTRRGLATALGRLNHTLGFDGTRPRMLFEDPGRR
jgi:DNA-binding MarR family transcriptional regulator